MSCKHANIGHNWGAYVRTGAPWGALGVVMLPPLTPLQKLGGVCYGGVTPIGYVLTLFNNKTKIKCGYIDPILLLALS